MMGLTTIGGCSIKICADNNVVAVAVDFTSARVFTHKKTEKKFNICLPVSNVLVHNSQ